MLDSLKGSQFWGSVVYFIKWSIISVVIGLVTGVIGSIFGKGVVMCASFFRAHWYMVFAMPFAGLAIIYVYHILGEDKNKGTNMVIESVYSESGITLTTAPAIFAGTLLTQLVGGSSGREGAALQMGGSLGSQIGSLLGLNEGDSKIAIMCGMSGAFAALFGTPMAAAFFSIEVISIGTIHYSGLVPCLFSALTGSIVANQFGLEAEHYAIGMVPAFDLKTVFYVVVLGAVCAVCAIMFCVLLHTTGIIYEELFENKYKRVVVGGILIIILTLLFRSLNYNGSGAALIEEAFEGEAPAWGFLLKMLFTAITLEAGFKGGEIVPTLTIGACVGSAFAMITGQPIGFFTACAMVATFAGVTNCPIASFILSYELFGGLGLAYFIICIAVSFNLSGYYSLYGTQKFVCSKTTHEYIDRFSTKHDVAGLKNSISGFFKR